ncbi:centromere protein I isoform X1 [Periophthalmus magnuspinnatus]|uniref:centromere protein I isoform X1 n=1 Tax=Periophthalmus magnuspinnatus TaxID=409849 RepID=UPI00145A5640|nr:centromere protein I isoform X1 [Periophthalmus magnuspinnatus]
MAEKLNLSGASNSDQSSSSDQSLSNRSINRSLRLAEKERRKNEAEDSFGVALKYFSEVKAGTPLLGNDEFERNLMYVEKMAYSKGLHPEAVSTMLEFAMSCRMGASPCTRVLKCLVPSSVVPQEAVVRAVVWLGISKISVSTQILFVKWVLTMFDLIDAKDQLRAIYGFIFNFVTDENLCPFICHLLYLLTRKENVRVFRVRKLLELQSKLGRQPFLLHLLSLYKVFCPELVTLSIPSRMKTGFKNHNAPWKSALVVVQKRNGSPVLTSISQTVSTSRKRKLGHMDLPALAPAVNKQMLPQSSLSRKLVPLVQIQSFAQLLENIHQIELPAQMGSLLGSSLALQYLDCLQDESALLRLNFWLGYALHEEFLFFNDGGANQNSEEAQQFLDKLLSTQHFLQEGFSSTEAFLYKFLNVWDGALMRPQILSLMSNIPVIPSSQIGRLLFEPLMQLFFTSSLFFKCGLMECLNNMLLKWLTWHSVYALEDDLDISLNSHTSINITLSGFKNSVMELVHFVGRLASVGLQVEGCHSLLLSFVLDFYETVCDMFLKYGLPLVVMPPPGVFYPALFATDPVSVDRLAYIMHRYKVNLASAKYQEKQTEQAFHINRQTFREFNHYVVLMVHCLWNSKMFEPGMGIELSEKLLLRSNVPDYKATFDLVHHPAFLSYAVDFHKQCWPKRKDMDLNSIKQSKPWGWYLEFLFSQGFDGLKHFVESNISWQVAGGDSQGDAVSTQTR